MKRSATSYIGSRTYPASFTMATTEWKPNAFFFRAGGWGVQRPGSEAHHSTEAVKYFKNAQNYVAISLRGSFTVRSSMVRSSVAAEFARPSNRDHTVKGRWDRISIEVSRASGRTRWMNEEWTNVSRSISVLRHPPISHLTRLRARESFNEFSRCEWCTVIPRLTSYPVNEFFG